MFTGGSLIVGSAARTDLVSPDRTVELARAQYGSVQRLLTLPDDLPVFPDPRQAEPDGLLALGGGLEPARLLDPAELPGNVRVVDNVAGLLGGLKLWA